MRKCRASRASAHRSKEIYTLDGPKKRIRPERDQTKKKYKPRKDSRSKLLKITEPEHNALP